MIVSIQKDTIDIAVMSGRIVGHADCSAVFKVKGSGTNASSNIIDMGGKSAFDLQKVTTLNLFDIKIQNSSLALNVS